MNIYMKIYIYDTDLTPQVITILNEKGFYLYFVMSDVFAWDEDFLIFLIIRLPDLCANGVLKLASSASYLNLSDSVLNLFWLLRMFVTSDSLETASCLMICERLARTNSSWLDDRMKTENLNSLLLCFNCSKKKFSIVCNSFPVHLRTF